MVADVRVILKWGRAVGLLSAAGVLATGCASGNADGGGRPLVIATTDILGDVVGQLAGDDAEVVTLIPRGADPHSFEASARQAAQLRDADLVIANGLGLEERLLDTLEAARGDGVPVLEIAPLVDPIPVGEDAHEERHDEDDTHQDEGKFDPHVWMDPLRMVRAVSEIAERLADVAPDVDWGVRAEAYETRIREAHEEIESILAPVPEEHRRLVTDHESLTYFAARYGFAVLGAVTPGISTLGAPSAGDLSRLAEVVRDERIPAVFVEVSQTRRLAEALAREVGAEVEVVTLFAGTLGDEASGAGTYLEMLTSDAQRIAEALT